MRLAITLLCIVLAGCVSAPYSTVVLDKSSMAHLLMRERANYAFTPGINGLVSVNERNIPGGPVRELWVSPGRRVIGFSCPGWITVDGPATITQTFAAGANYEVTCEAVPAIELIR
jgi:hypothetical protein